MTFIVFLRPCSKYRPTFPEAQHFHASPTKQSAATRRSKGDQASSQQRKASGLVHMRQSAPPPAIGRTKPVGALLSIGWEFSERRSLASADRTVTSLSLDTSTRQPPPPHQSTKGPAFALAAPLPTLAMVDSSFPSSRREEQVPSQTVCRGQVTAPSATAPWGEDGRVPATLSAFKSFSQIKNASYLSTILGR